MFMHGSTIVGKRLRRTNGRPVLAAALAGAMAEMQLSAFAFAPTRSLRVAQAGPNCKVPSNGGGDSSSDGRTTTNTTARQRVEIKYAVDDVSAVGIPTATVRPTKRKKSTTAAVQLDTPAAAQAGKGQASGAKGQASGAKGQASGAKGQISGAKGQVGGRTKEASGSAAPPALWQQQLQNIRVMRSARYVFAWNPSMDARHGPALDAFPCSFLPKAPDCLRCHCTAHSAHDISRDRDAPVDSMGCEVLRTLSAPPAVQRFEVLVALMLSSQVGARKVLADAG